MKCKNQYKDLEKYRRYRNNYNNRYYSKTRKTAYNSAKRWTDEDIEMILEHNITDRELAIKLGRSQKAIEQKRNKLKRNRIEFIMCVGIRFNRPVDPTKDFISPGGYNFTMGNKNIQFDFETYSGNVDKKDRCLVHMEMKYPDYNTFPEMYLITESKLRSVSKISEFYVYIHEDSDLNPLIIEYCYFSLPYKDSEKISIDMEVLEEIIF